MTEFLDWLARGVGVLAVILSLLGFMFREKWKQLLQRSLSSDLERLKADLSRENAEHAAKLFPQLEQIKHDFQQKLEAYKVSLIAQAEAVKAQSELKKTIALRYSEIEFERLVSLEKLLAPIGSNIAALGSIDPAHKTLEHTNKALSDLNDLRAAADQAELFIPLEDKQEINFFRRALLDYLSAHLGPEKPVPPPDDPLYKKIIEMSASTHSKLKVRIKKLGTLSQEAQA